MSWDTYHHPSRCVTVVATQLEPMPADMTSGATPSKRPDFNTGDNRADQIIRVGRVATETFRWTELVQATQSRAGTGWLRVPDVRLYN